MPAAAMRDLYVALPPERAIRCLSRQSVRD